MKIKNITIELEVINDSIYTIENFRTMIKSFFFKEK